MNDEVLLKAQTEAQSMSEVRLQKLLADGPSGLRPELWETLVEEARRRAAVTPVESDVYREYEDVPWFRRSGVNSTLLLAGLLFPPAMAVVCGTLVTGDVYYDQTLPDGTLKRWSRANRVVALVVFCVQVAGIVLRLVLRSHRGS